MYFIFYFMFFPLKVSDFQNSKFNFAFDLNGREYKCWILSTSFLIVFHSYSQNYMKVSSMATINTFISLYKIMSFCILHTVTEVLSKMVIINKILTIYYLKILLTN